MLASCPLADELHARMQERNDAVDSEHCRKRLKVVSIMMQHYRPDGISDADMDYLTTLLYASTFPLLRDEFQKSVSQIPYVWTYALQRADVMVQAYFIAGENMLADDSDWQAWMDGM